VGVAARLQLCNGSRHHEALPIMRGLGLKMGHREDYFENGWCLFDHDPAIARWVEETLPAARATVTAPQHAQWHRCGGSWFVGVNALGNDASGAVSGGCNLQGRVADFVRNDLDLPALGWEPGQVSVCYPGYPQATVEESEASHRYRVRRDAAHVDGLKAEGPDRRRYLGEYHGFLVGIPMVETNGGAAPFVVWRGSHHHIRKMLQNLFTGLDASQWSGVDVTDAYHAARREIFNTCERVVVEAQPGQAYVVHRMTLHGIAPWAPGASAGPDGRMIVYFRPALASIEEWMKLQ
jgi:hypothetical protein